MAEVLDPAFEFFLKSPVFLIDIKIITFEKIIGYIDIGIPVVIDVSNGYAKAKPDQASIDICRFADVYKFSVIVP
jgi:hypothetical protein